MKKFFVFLSLAVLTLGIGSLARATGEFGTLDVTFIRTKDAPEEKVMLHVWGTGSGGSGATRATSQDDNVYKFTLNIAADATGPIGVIPVLEKEDGQGGVTQDWDNKLSFGAADLYMDISDIKGAGKKHVVFFENAKDGEYVYSSVDPTGYLVFVAYYAASYEENLGVHNWGFTENASGWGAPLKAFKTVGNAPDGSAIKGALFEATDITTAGLLIYAGDDATKKHAAHGDIKQENGDLLDATAGEVCMVAVTGDTVFNNDMSAFCEDAFKFKFIESSVDANGNLDGTYASGPKNILVKTSAEVLVPTTDGETTLTADQRKAKAAEYFTVCEKADATKTVAIDHVDFNLLSTTGVKDFVLVLSGTLDNTKEYVVKFDDKALKQAEIEINLDTENPAIQLVGAPTDNIYSVAWGKPFDMKDFPKFVATDDRDGDITASVYIKSGEGRLDTREKGDYPITLRVEDKWGNTGTLTFTFRVE